MTLEEKIAEIIGTGLEYYDGLTITQKRGLGTVEEYLASELSSLCVGVKLEWEYIAETVNTYEMWQATTPFGVATIVNGEESARLVGFGPVKDFDTVDAAKADLASRIISCLNIRTEEEVRREYLEELIELCGERHAIEMTRRGRDPVKYTSPWDAACHRLRSLQQEGKSDA